MKCLIEHVSNRATSLSNKNRVSDWDWFRLGKAPGARLGLVGSVTPRKASTHNCAASRVTVAVASYTDSLSFGARREIYLPYLNWAIHNFRGVILSGSHKGYVVESFKMTPHSTIRTAWLIRPAASRFPFRCCDSQDGRAWGGNREQDLAPEVLQRGRISQRALELQKQRRNR